MADEGVGVHLVEALRSRLEADRGDIDFVSLGTHAMRLLHEMEGRRRVYLIDCTYFDASPGTIRSFQPEEVNSLKCVANLSLHEGDLLQLLSLAQQLDIIPEKVIFFGVQPADVSMGEELSPTLQENLPRYIEYVTETLDQHR